MERTLQQQGARRPQVQPWLVTLVVSVLIATDIFIYCFILPITPFLLQRCHVAPKDVAFWSSALLSSSGGAFLLAAPVVGVVSHQGRHQHVLMWLAVGLMAISTGVLWAATSPPVMAVSRGLHGVSTAIVWVVAPALLVRTVGRHRAGGALGSVCSVMCFSLATSPMLVGLLYDQAGTSSIFGLAFGVIGCDAVLLLIICRRIGVRSTASRTALVSPADSAASSPTTSATDTVSVIVYQPKGVVGVPGQYANDADVRAGVRPLGELLLLRSVWMAMLANGLFNAVLAAFDAQASNFLLRIFGWTSLRIGLAFLAFYGPNVVLGFFIGRLNDRCGTRWITVAGLVVSCPAWVCLRFVEDNNDAHKALFIILVAIAGVGAALSQTSLMVVFAHLCGSSAYSQSYGLFNVSAAAGQLVGPLCLAPLYASGGWPTFALVLGMLCLASIPPVLFLPTGAPGDEHALANPVGANTRSL